MYCYCCYINGNNIKLSVVSLKYSNKSRPSNFIITHTMRIALVWVRNCGSSVLLVVDKTTVQPKIEKYFYNIYFYIKHSKRIWLKKKKFVTCVKNERNNLKRTAHIHRACSFVQIILLLCWTKSFSDYLL